MTEQTNDNTGKTSTDRGAIVVYQTEDDSVRLAVQLENETIWLSQRQMVELFDKDTDTIGLHTCGVRMRRGKWTCRT